ncbi:hypothetical protein JRI60_51635 [Archangium violaceum]|uniref:hypothetical protein n=1 Tax=Archangium violaceum TaxID=83451 RepID=UPI00194DF652|nr:hypothetical protein [Archangium violaceum]QRN97307.1 hypothetical protein JRI60_51635 [Archangium violaceum]
MKSEWGLGVAVCLALVGCDMGRESPESAWPSSVQAGAMREERGATRHARPVAGAVFGRTVGVDRKGNTFVSLTYERGGVDLGGGALPGEAGLALAKYAPGGKHLWSLGFPTYTGIRPTVSAMAVDASGNLYIAGEHREPSLSLGGEPVPSGPFLAKYAPDGTHLWSHPAALPGVTLLPPSALALDEEHGHLVVAVNFLDPGRAIGSALVGRVRVEDGGVLSLEPVVRWGSLSVTSLGLTASGHIAVAGFFEGKVDLGGGPLSTALRRTPFIARFTPDMRHVWSRGLSGAEGVATGVAVTSGRVVVVGEYSGAFTFRGQAQPADGKDAFIAAYNDEGQEVWTRHFAESATAVAVDEENRVVVVGQYCPGDDAGGPRLPTRAKGGADNHLFVVKLYQGSGGHEWSRGLLSDGVLRASALAETRAGEGVILSTAQGSVDVGTGRMSVPPDSAVLLRLGR